MLEKIEKITINFAVLGNNTILQFSKGRKTFMLFFIFSREISQDNFSAF